MMLKEEEERGKKENKVNYKRVKRGRKGGIERR